VEILQPHFEQNCGDRVWLAEMASLAREELKLDVPIVSGYLGAFLFGLDDLDKQLALCRSFAPVAEIFGARMLRAFVGNVCEVTSKNIDPVYYRYVVDGFKQICSIAADYNLKISCEMHDESVIDTDASVLQFIEDVGADNIGVTFQLDGIPSYSGISALELYDKIRPHILHMHLNPYPHIEHPDNPANYRDLLVRLDRENPEYHVSIENCRSLQTPLQAMQRGVRMIEMGRRGEIIEKIDI
jgi:sugar phosphate isomerase/epimerase